MSDKSEDDSSPKDFKTVDEDYFKPERLEIISALEGSIKQQYGSSAVYSMIKPYFGRTGKKLRPLISVYVYRLLKGDTAPLDRLKPILSSIEIAHNASLIVDDVFDRDRLRRGDLSFFVKYGTFAALSIAYNLSAFVFDLATQTNHAEVVRTVGSAASELSLALYLSKDLKSSKVISEEFFMDVLRKKTSSLFKSASKSAALLGTDDPNDIFILTNFGEYYGNAYQLRDDVLAIEGSFKDLGKEPDSDITNRFQSLITIYAMKMASTEDLQILNGFYLQNEDHDPELIRQILIRSGGSAAVKERCLEYRQMCFDILEKFTDSVAKDKLSKLLLMINFDTLQ